MRHNSRMIFTVRDPVMIIDRNSVERMLQTSNHIFVCICRVCRSIRVQFTAEASFARETDGVIFISRVTAYFHSEPYVITEGQPLDMNRVLTSFNAQVDGFNARGSSFVLENIRRFVMSILPYRPLVGSSYIASPKWLKTKRCAVNVKNNDHECFKWAVVSCLYEPKTHKDELYNYLPYKNTLNFDGIRFQSSIQRSCQK